LISPGEIKKTVGILPKSLYDEFMSFQFEIANGNRGGIFAFYLESAHETEKIVRLASNCQLEVSEVV
jgi:hypothetical protein